jgi:hypothetical protein
LLNDELPTFDIGTDVLLFNVLSLLLKQDETEWYGTNGDDRAVASGIYFIVIQTSYYTETVKVAVIR